MNALSHATTQHECFAALVREPEGLPLTSGLNDTERLSLAMTVRWPYGLKCPRTLIPGLEQPKLSILREAETPTIAADLTLPMPGYHVFAYDNNQIEAVTSRSFRGRPVGHFLEGDLVSVDTALLCCM